MLKKILLIAVAATTSFAVNAKEITKERSIYRNVVIVEEGDVRCMRFETRRRQITNQACMDLKNKDRLVFEYAHGALAAYAIQPKPKRILVLGLGGGTLSNVLHEMSPEAEIVNVDIDPVVVKLARQYFDYKEDDRVRTEIKDGRVFIKRAILKKEKYDWIILDAFNGDYIPEHLMTKEFLAETKSLLSEGGVLSANTFSNSLLYDYESATYQNVFGKLHIFKAPTKGNRVVFGCNCEFEEFPKFDQSLADKVKKYGVDLEKVWGRISDRVDWNPKSEVLTDQYSPANLLKQDN